MTKVSCRTWQLAADAEVIIEHTLNVFCLKQLRHIVIHFLRSLTFFLQLLANACFLWMHITYHYLIDFRKLLTPNSYSLKIFLDLT